MVSWSMEVYETNSPMVHLTLLLSDEGNFSLKIYILLIVGPFVIHLVIILIAMEL